VSNGAEVRVVAGPLVGPVLARVVGMLAARAQCPVDRLDDALLVADAIAAHAPAHSADGHVTVRLETADDELAMTVLGLRDGGARGVLADAALPGVGNVLERIADEVAADGDALTLRLRFSGGSVSRSGDVPQ
jgi:hypothetical protein